MAAEIALSDAILGGQPDFADALDRAFDADTELPAEAESFVPTTLRDAEYAAQRLAHVERRIAEVEREAAHWHEKVDAWKAGELQQPLRKKDLYSRWLEAYGLEQRALDPKQKTTKLPSATISTRGESEWTVYVDDEQAVLAWADETLAGIDYDRIVRIVRSIRISELRKLVKVHGGRPVSLDGGEIVPGVKVRPPSTTASVSIV